MGYLQDLVKNADKLDNIAQAYLDRLSFIPNDQVMQRVWDAAVKLACPNGEELDFTVIDWEGLPDWAADTLDGWMPFASKPRNGSLKHLLGSSVVALDANLRHLLEVVEGRDTFPIGKFDMK